MEKNEKKVLLSVNDLKVQFRVRGRILTAIRGISLDIYENECIAIVGESGSGKSVFTKTFAGMLDANGFISEGSIIFNDEELADTKVTVNGAQKKLISYVESKLNTYAKLEAGADIYREFQDKLSEMTRAEIGLSREEQKSYDDRIKKLKFERTEAYNLKQQIDSKKERERYKETVKRIRQLDEEIKALLAEELAKEKENSRKAKQESLGKKYEDELKALKAKHKKACMAEVPAEKKERNRTIAKEIYLSVGRYGFWHRIKLIFRLLAAMKQAMRMGVDLSDEKCRSDIFDTVAFRVAYLDETEDTLHGRCVLNLAKVQYKGDWGQIRGGKIATVFQDPMTSLNPIITIGKQISSIIIKHQGCSEAEARIRALEIMEKVGIPDPELRYDDYPFQYSGGMRQRIVIAIALSCHPKILICDEPTTALDVTIQAQILQLIKDLQKEFGYTTVFITHDLGVVASVADRVAVLYAGQIVEYGTVEEVFYDPRHPYTWALLSSLPQLAERNTELFSITGTPPSLYNEVVGDAFAPRNNYCLKIDTLAEPPMFAVSDSHYAKTWLLHPDAPKIEKPDIIRDIHGRLISSFNI